VTRWKGMFRFVFRMSQIRFSTLHQLYYPSCIYNLFSPLRHCECRNWR